MVERPVEFTFDELLAMSLREEAVTLACVSNKVGEDLVGNAYWRGVPLPTLLREAGVQADATAGDRARRRWFHRRLPDGRRARWA